MSPPGLTPPWHFHHLSSPVMAGPPHHGITSDSASPPQQRPWCRVGAQTGQPLPSSAGVSSISWEEATWEGDSGGGRDAWAPAFSTTPAASCAAFCGLQNLFPIHGLSCLSKQPWEVGGAVMLIYPFYRWTDRSPGASSTLAWSRSPQPLWKLQITVQCIAFGSDSLGLNAGH